jgi:hypothetical protein
MRCRGEVLRCGTVATNRNMEWGVKNTRSGWFLSVPVARFPLTPRLIALSLLFASALSRLRSVRQSPRIRSSRFAPVGASLNQWYAEQSVMNGSGSNCKITANGGSTTTGNCGTNNISANDVLSSGYDDFNGVMQGMSTEYLLEAKLV